MTRWELMVLAGYYGILAILSVFCAHRLWLLLGLMRARLAPPPALAGPGAALPTITIQIPLYNEYSVARRVIDAACRLDYPRDLVDVQVLDDSDDETVLVAAAAVSHWHSQGIRIQHIRRGGRTGFKAGALAHGLQHSKAELVAVFDADFIPSPDFLKRLVSHFCDLTVGMVQARWEFVNRNASMLTRLQATMLDAHFRIEHRSRAARGLFFNFNGTAGIWRRAAIDDAGGWQHDTLTEDLDISYRAQLRGWNFIYRDDVAVSSELPATMHAYHSQQRRWTKGSVETARKILPAIWRSGSPLANKFDATANLLCNLAYPLVVLLVLLSFVAFQAREFHGLHELRWADWLALMPCTGGFLLYFMVAARTGGTAWIQSLALAAGAICLGIGISLNNSISAIEGLLGFRSPFVRTPKEGNGGFAGGFKPTPLSMITLAEALLGAHSLLLAGVAFYSGVAFALPFALLFSVGFLGVAAISLLQAARPRKQDTAIPLATPNQIQETS